MASVRTCVFLTYLSIVIEDSAADSSQEVEARLQRVLDRAESIIESPLRFAVVKEVTPGIQMTVLREIGDAIELLTSGHWAKRYKLRKVRQVEAKTALSMAQRFYANSGLHMSASEMETRLPGWREQFKALTFTDQAKTLIRHHGTEISSITLAAIYITATAAVHEYARGKIQRAKQLLDLLETTWVREDGKIYGFLGLDEQGYAIIGIG